MQVKEKINLTKYSIGTVANALIIIFIASSKPEHIYFQLVVLASSVVNQLMLCGALQFILGNQVVPKKNIKIMGFIIGKSLILLGGFAYATQNMGERVIICVFIYIFQLIILALSIKRDAD